MEKPKTVVKKYYEEENTMRIRENMNAPRSGYYFEVRAVL